jgi:GT2 family glycosyltransferase
MNVIAVLLTTHNRVNKTLLCLDSFHDCSKPKDYSFDIYLVDDGSTDSTAELVKIHYPNIHIVKGDGNLYWAGGMRKAWNFALKQKNYDGFLLLNDDVVLYQDALLKLQEADIYAITHYQARGLYVLATNGVKANLVSYGGSLVRKNFFTYNLIHLNPLEFPTDCHIANANILLVSKRVVDAIGIFDISFTHGIADYDYTYTAYKLGFPMLLCSGIGGKCEDDHGPNWLSSDKTLRQRINYLYDIKGLAYKESIYFLKKHFKQQLPYYFLMYWLKVFFPIMWDKFK